MFGLSKPEKKILIPVLSILLGLCTLAYYAHRYSSRLITASQSIEQEEEIKHHLREVLSGTVDMENDVHNYLLTGDNKFITANSKALAAVTIHLHQLGSIPGITSDQVIQISQLQQLVEEKSALATQTIELRRQKGLDEAVAHLSTGQDIRLLDQINILTGIMLQEVQARLTKLQEQQHTAIQHFALTYYFLLLKIAITVVTVLTLLVLYFIRRKKSEKQLTATRQLFHDVLDHTTSFISIKDLSGRFILLNQAHEQAFNIREENVKGKTVFDIFEKDVANAIRNADLEVIRQQQQMKFEEIAPQKGELRHFVSLKFPLFDEHHIPYAVCSISTDETEKFQIEKQHQEEMSRVMDLFNNAPCGYQATNKDGIIIEINETLLHWLGYTRNEIIGKMSARDLLSKESQSVFSYYFPRIRSGEITSVYDVEVTYLRKDKSPIAMVANSIAQYEDDGEFLYTRTSLFDITLRKQVEALTTHSVS
jgi:PAS domain S-box-containing protein